MTMPETAPGGEPDAPATAAARAHGPGAPMGRHSLRETLRGMGFALIRRGRTCCNRDHRSIA